MQPEWALCAGPRVARVAHSRAGIPMTLPSGAGECPLALADHRELASDHWDGLQPERDCCRLSDAQARPGTAVTPRPGATRDFS